MAVTLDLKGVWTDADVAALIASVAGTVPDRTARGQLPKAEVAGYFLSVLAYPSSPSTCRTALRWSMRS